MGAVVREQGKPIPIVPKPMRGTNGPFLPNGRMIDDKDAIGTVLNDPLGLRLNNARVSYG
jgi:hypothetical protein